MVAATAFSLRRALLFLMRATKHRRRIGLVTRMRSCRAFSFWTRSRDARRLHSHVLGGDVQEGDAVATVSGMSAVWDRGLGRVWIRREYSGICGGGGMAGVRCLVFKSTNICQALLRRHGQASPFSSG